MKILFVLEHYYPYIGGAEKLFTLLAEALAAEGQEVEVVTTLFNPELPRSEVIKGVQVTRVNCRNRFLFTAFSLPAIIKRARKCDIIHTTTYNAAIPAWMGAKLSGKPAIVTFHEVWGTLWKRLPFLSALEKTAFYYYEQLILKLGFQRFIAVSEFTREALIASGIPSARVSRIYNGLDYQRFEKYQHQAPASFTYTYFGRLGVSKGLNLLLPAAAQFSQQYPDSRLVLILPKRPEAMYQCILAEIKHLGIEEHVQLRHELSREDLYQQISHSSCVVIPSYSEGFCFVAAETVAMGVPVVSSDLGALKEVVGGKMIRMASQTTEGMLEALLKARRGEWEEKERKRFEMGEALEAYLELYRRLEIETT